MPCHALSRRLTEQELCDGICGFSIDNYPGNTTAPTIGQKEIILTTGPHLGGFDQAISVPGLVDFLYNFSSLCISYCFEKENRLKPLVN